MKKQTAHKGRSILWRIAVVAFLGYGVVSFVMLQADLAAKNQELETIRGKIAQQQQINHELETLLDESNYGEYVARIAREKYGYGYQDGRSFVDVSGS